MGWLSIVSGQPVTTPLKRDLFVRSHSGVNRNGQCRGLEINEVQWKFEPPQQRPKFITHPFLVSTGVLNLDNLPFVVFTHRTIDFHEVFRLEVEDRCLPFCEESICCDTSTSTNFGHMKKIEQMVWNFCQVAPALPKRVPVAGLSFR